MPLFRKGWLIKFFCCSALVTDLAQTAHSLLCRSEADVDFGWLRGCTQREDVYSRQLALCIVLRLLEKGAHLFSSAAIGLLDD